MLSKYFNIGDKWSESNTSKQIEMFTKNSLDRMSALKKLNDVTQNLFELDYSENRGMWSEHLVIFSALSLNEEIDISSILEIGTFKGETTLILSELFPKANITSIDLKQEKTN
jgi:predicted O-methyltransferase YrrM